jgi:hypothetical protein
MQKYTDEDLIEAVRDSYSIRQVIIKLGRKPGGGNYKTVKKKIHDLKLDTSHFTGKLWSKGRTLSPKRNINCYLSNEYPIQSHNLRLRLIREGFFDYKCYNCLNELWMGEPIPLELEHINGNHLDNRLENLTILCPNCHALTPTYRGKNIERK